MTSLQRTTLLAIACMLSASRLAAQAADPILGTWALNVARSTFGAGPAPRSESRTYVLAGEETKMTFKSASEPRTYRTVRQEIKATSEGVDADGQATTGEWTFAYDGQDRPMAGSPDADMLSAKRLDAVTTQFTGKKAGRVVLVSTAEISAEGKVLTIRTKGINARGQTIDDVAVFDKR